MFNQSPDTAADRFHGCAAFTRKELLVTLAVVAVLLGLGALLVVKMRGKSSIAVCRDNLRQLGAATAVYEQQSGGRLPYAYLHLSDQNQTTWDTLIMSMIRAAMRGGKMDEPAPSAKQAGRILLCPADTVPAVAWALKWNHGRRTYAMADDNMLPANWPPGPGNATGVGVHWSFGAKGDRPPAERIYNFAKTNEQAVFKLDMIPAPAHTMILTERVRPANVLGNIAGAVINNTADHMEKGAVPSEKYHQGRYNYLMVDGHVESLFPEETVGPRGQTGEQSKTHQGIWTVKADD